MTKPNDEFTVLLQTPCVDSFDEWREVARHLISQNIGPHQVEWQDSNAPQNNLLVSQPLKTCGQPIDFRVSKSLMQMLRTAACFRRTDRWAFLYRILWRWHQGDQVVLSPADVDGHQLHTAIKAVRHETHDMRAYVRFRERIDTTDPPRFVAWFEPAHDILPEMAQHFADRMGRTTWLIATPERSVFWDGSTLHEHATVLKGPADLDDAGEALWLIYYRSIFNPARLNPRIMKSHVASRFWKNLPEGKLAGALASEAARGARKVSQATPVGKRQGHVIKTIAKAVRDV